MAWPSRVTIRREFIKLLIGSLLLVVVINLGRYVTLQQERRNAALAEAILSLELHIHHTLQGVSEWAANAHEARALAVIRLGVAETGEAMARVGEFNQPGTQTLVDHWRHMGTELAPLLAGQVPAHWTRPVRTSTTICSRRRVY